MREIIRKRAVLQPGETQLIQIDNERDVVLYIKEVYIQGERFTIKKAMTGNLYIFRENRIYFYNVWSPHNLISIEVENYDQSKTNQIEVVVTFSEQEAE